MFIKGLLDLIFPPRCWACGVLTEDSLCFQCFSQIRFIEAPFCLKCGKPTYLETGNCRECRHKDFKFLAARSLGFFDGVLREAIHQFKYGNGRKLASFFADLMRARVAGPFWECDFLTFVPLSKSKEFERGYNQAKILAEEISKLVDRPCRPALFLKKQPQDQSRLSSLERRKNVRGAFSLAEGISLEGKTVLLIDDVFTTGSTVNECAKVLVKGGACEVKVATIARSIIL